MERTLKKNGESANPQHVAQGKFTSKSRESELVKGIDSSPMMVAQHKKLQSLFSGAMQLKGMEEEPLQGKLDPVQRVGQEPLQGKFSLESHAQMERPSVAKPDRTPLTDNLKSVRVHDNSSQPAHDITDSTRAQLINNGSSVAVQRAAIPEELVSHRDELNYVISDIRKIKGPKNKTNEPLENTIGGAENWAVETRYAAKRKYVEYLRASEAYARGAEDISLGEDTTTESDIEYWEGGDWQWEESKVVNGQWPQLSENVLAARAQLAGRTEKNGVGIASITLSEGFYMTALNELGEDKATVEANATYYLTNSMRKKTPSEKNTKFFVRLFDADNNMFAEVDVTKWHR